MSEFSYLADRAAAHQIRERIAQKQRSAMPPRRRRSARKAIASGLHNLADRLDS